MLSNGKSRVCAALLLGVAASIAQADTVYDNFGPGNDGFEYSTSESWLIAGYYSGFYYTQRAQSFTPSDTGHLSDIYIGLMKVMQVNECHVMLVPNNGEPPSEDDVLEHWVLHDSDLPLVGGGEPCPATRLLSADNPLLTAGQDYWIWVWVDDGSSAAWGKNVTGALDHMMQYHYVYPYGVIWDDMGNAVVGGLRVDTISGALGDFDQDGDVDEDDAVAFIDCYNGGGDDCHLADFDGDDDVDCDDWEMFKGVWTGPPAYPDLFPDCDVDCNGNLIADDFDIADGISEDCNDNDIPDECDIAEGASPDCNLNGVPDECDIAEGASQDCNANGVPDECDIAEGVSQDCNANGVPDECDIADGTSDDCQLNGIPDECDIADGSSEDVNENGIPDECEFAATDTVYDNFGTGNDGFDYDTAESWLIAGFYSGFYYVEQAQSFTPSVTGNLTDLYLGVMKVIAVNECHVVLAADRGQPPTESEVLEEWILYDDDLPVIGGGEPRPATRLVSYEHPLLTAGQSYWIWIWVDHASSAAWGKNVTNTNDHMMQREYEDGNFIWYDIGYQRAGALRVDVAIENPCPADVNADEIVNIDDLFAVLAVWGACDDCIEDINDDGLVDIDDVFAVLAAWGPCP